MMKRLLVLPLTLGVACAATAAQQEAAKPDVSKAQQIATTVCVGCHGADGNSVAPVNPKLAGQIPDYISKQLRNFKAADGKPAERNNPIMGGMVAALSDDDMKALGAYFSSQKLNPEKSKGDKGMLDLGQKLWRGGDASKGVPACAGCHGAAGAGLPAQFPRLAGQYAEYTESQLKAFRLGERANDPNSMMRMIAVKMTDREIKAVSDYAAGLR